MPLPYLPLSTIFKENRYGHVQWQRLADNKRKRLEIKWLKNVLFCKITKNVFQNIRINRLKTKLFEFITTHRYVIFMDSDILIGQKLAPFVAHCRSIQQMPDGQAVVTLFTDIGPFRRRRRCFRLFDYLIIDYLSYR